MAQIHYRAFWGINKRQELLESLDESNALSDANYSTLHPTPENRFILRPGAASDAYSSWAGVNELSRASDWSGMLEKRRGALMDHNPEALRQRMSRYCDPAISFPELRSTGTGPILAAAGFDPIKARAALLEAGGTKAGRFERISLYPFDDRWCFHTNVQPVWNRSRPEVAVQQAAGNLFLVTRARARRPEEGYPCFATAALPGDHLLDPNAHPFPFVLHVSGNIEGGLALGGAVAPNLSDAAIAWCVGLGLPATPETSRLVWHHALAVSYSPAWLSENGAGIRQGWPRIPLPDSAELLRRSASLGAEIAALVDLNSPVTGVTAGTPRPELAAIAVPTTAPGATRDWRLNAGWGTRTEKGITMPGRGKAAARSFGAGENAGAVSSGLLGATTRDVWMNGASYWRNVPEAVWALTIGGYQVLKKWLSYREETIIQRSLGEQEVTHFQAMTRRLSTLLLMGPELDANYRACAEAHRRLREL